MQFVVKRDILLKSLNFVQGVVEKKNTLPILSNVLLQLKDNKLSIVATDLDIIFYDKINDVKILKETHWFFMQFDGVPNTIPQLEEGITEVSWKSKDDSIKLAKVSYPSILSVFNTAVPTP